MPSVTVNFPKELGGTATIQLREGESPQAAIDRRLAAIQSHQVTPEDVGGTFREGLGAGLANVARRATNLALPDRLTPEFASDEAIAEQEELDKYLTFGHGGGGKLVGELIATTPVAGGVGGAVARGASGLARGGRGANYLTRTLNRGAGRGAVEGAAVGATLADPGERGAGAVVGGMFGGVLGGAGTVLGKALGKGKMVDITKEAKELQKMTGQFIPLSQSAEAGLVKQFYNAFLANFPGIGGKVRAQYQEALDDLRRFAGEHAIPDTQKAHNLANLTGRESVEEMLTKMSRYWDEAFEEIKLLPDGSPRTFRIFSDTPFQMDKTLTKKVLEFMPSNFQIPRVGQDIPGSVLLDLKTALGKVAQKYSGTARGGEILRIQKQIDAILKRNLNPTGKGRGAGARILREYEDATRYWGPWNAFQRAALKAKNNMDFSPAQLAKTSIKGKGGLVLANKGPQQRAGELGVEALENFPSRQGLFQTLAATGPVAAAGGGALAGGAAGAGLALLATYGIGKAMVSKGLQKYLSGQTRRQRLNKVLMRKYSEELRKLGLGARQIAMVLGANDAS